MRNFLIGFVLIAFGIILVDYPGTLGAQAAPGLSDALIVIGGVLVAFWLKNRGWDK